MQAQRSGAQARNRRFDQRQASSIEHSDRGISHSIKFANPFADSLVSVTGRVENVSHVFVEAFVTQRPTSRSYACGLAAPAGDADATLSFLQAIDAAHCLNLVGEHEREEVRPERESSFAPRPRMMRRPVDQIHPTSSGYRGAERLRRQKIGSAG
jgi:hypothetical protein